MLKILYHLGFRFSSKCWSAALAVTFWPLTIFSKKNFISSSLPSSCPVFVRKKAKNGTMILSVKNDKVRNCPKIVSRSIFVITRSSSNPVWRPRLISTKIEESFFSSLDDLEIFLISSALAIRPCASAQISKLKQTSYMKNGPYAASVCKC